MDLEVQDMKGMIMFSSKDVVWSEIHRENMSIDCVALVPSHRVVDFIKGEEGNGTFVRKHNKKPAKRASVALQYEL